MLKPAVTPLLYSRLWPNPKPNDPVSFQAHITRNLVPEVRLETATFYGLSECLEAQYPGLDYTNTAHRARLVRFTWHRRLFRAFDELSLTISEIDTLCRWEGTKFARQKYERDNNTTIRDTTWDGVEYLEQKRATAIRTPLRDVTDRGMDNLEMSGCKTPLVNEVAAAEVSDEEDLEEESDDELQQSIGVDLNRRLIAATEARARGEEAVMDEDWEQWLKEAAERSGTPSLIQSPGPSQDPMDHPGPYGQTIPAIFSSNPTPQVRALQAQLPSPPRYTDYVSATASAPATGTAM